MIEESPCVAIDDTLRERMGSAAVRAAKAAHYVNAGTIEFLLEPDGNFYFMEMNTRIQVEHPVTEWVTGVDLIQEQLRVASGMPLSVTQGRSGFRGMRLSAGLMRRIRRRISGLVRGRLRRCICLVDLEYGWIRRRMTGM